MLSPRSRSVTVGAHDIALADFEHEAIVLRKKRSRTAQPELLLTRIAMVEVHLMRLVLDAAAGTRSVLQDREELTGSFLTLSNAGDLLGSMGPVVPAICLGLITTRDHGQV